MAFPNLTMKNIRSFKILCRIKETSRAIWKFPELSQHNNGGVGSLRARFQLTNGPGSQGTIAAQFNCEGTTLSGVDFQLIGPGYRLSLAKKRFVSGIQKTPKDNLKLTFLIDLRVG